MIAFFMLIPMTMLIRIILALLKKKDKWTTFEKLLFAKALACLFIIIMEIIQVNNLTINYFFISMQYHKLISVYF